MASADPREAWAGHAQAYIAGRLETGTIRPSVASLEAIVLGQFTATMAEIPVARISTADVERWKASMAGLAPATRIGREGIVRRFLTLRALTAGRASGCA